MENYRTAALSEQWLCHVIALLVFLSALVDPACAQEKRDSLVTVTLKNRSFREALSIIESRTHLKFAYSTELAAGQKNISITAARMPPSEFLRTLFEGTAITWQIIGDQVVLQGPVPPSRITLSGYIKDARTGELLIGASVYLPGSGTGVLTNSYGFYSITAPPADTLDLEISYVGYNGLSRRIAAGDDPSQSFQLERSNVQEEINKTIIFKDKREDNVKKNQAARIDLSTDMIAAAPSAGGGGDLISSVEMLPGVQAGIDGSPGYFVRGGNAGQNLILLDDATLYNPSHTFGLVGIFNPPTVKYATLMKGGFPASYGDHVSSVLDVAMKDGSNLQTGGSVQLGTVSSGITLYGPLQTEKSSYLVSARRSTTDIVLKPLLDSNYFRKYYFYDVNAKLNFQLSAKDRLLLSFYSGRDNNTYASDSAKLDGIDYSMHYGNTGATLRWNHQYSGKLFAHSSIEYNKYHQFLSATQYGFFAQLYSGITDVNARTALDWYLSPSHKLSAGADYLHQTLYPASLSGQVPPPDSTSQTIVPSGIPPKISNRVAVYVSDEIKLGDRWQAYAGLRAPYFYKDGARYFSLEPRLSLLYMIDPSTSVKFSYTNMHQYIHLVQSYNASFPAEIWIGSSKAVRPQSSNEYTAGLFKNFSQNVFQTSLEVYYKQMGNQLLFGGRDSTAIDNTIEQKLIFGKGWSYGAELFIRKNRGKWTGWLAYTLAYTWQQFDSLNQGQTFPFAYDRRHMLDISLAYNISSHWKVAANFLLASGRAFSLSPDSSYILNPGPGRNPLYDNPGRAVGRDNGNGGGNGNGNGNGNGGGNGNGNNGNGNGPGSNNGNAYGRNRPIGSWDVVANNYRLTPYDRLDVNIRYTKSRTIGKRTLATEWIFSVYNVYARSNNSFVYRTIDPATRKVVAKELPFIPVAPSITYSLKF